MAPHIKYSALIVKRNGAYVAEARDTVSLENSMCSITEGPISFRAKRQVGSRKFTAVDD